uniref:Uncharacterized protein n=1 Tax=Panagrolaimus sp. JU765 TaxID=591449 RepID=A0AC34RNC2_9BILA
MMHRKLTRENLPKGYEKSPAMKMVKTAYETCRTGTEDLAPLDEMIKSIEASILQNSTMADIADTVAALQSNFGVDTFFNRVNDVDLRFSWDLRNIVADAKAENSSNWQIFDLKDFEMSDDSFDFKTYVKTLTVDMPNLDLDSIKVVVTDPAYVERIVALVKEQQTPTAVLKNFFLKTLRISILADFDDCMQALENYVPHAATVIYLSIMKDADVEAARQKLYKTFEQTVEEMENIVGKYLSNDRQKRLAKEKLEKVDCRTQFRIGFDPENA